MLLTILNLKYIVCRMIGKSLKIAVTSVSFSNNKFLTSELSKLSPNLRLRPNRNEKFEVSKFLKDVDIAIVGLDEINTSVLKNTPSLKFISKYGVGLNNIDIQACEEYGVKVGWKGGVNKRSVSEMTLGFMLMLARNLYPTSLQLKDGIWNKSGGFEITGKKIGIIGYGHIGQDLRNLLKSFGAEVFVNDIKKIKDKTVQFVDKNFIYENCDLITIHTPYDDSTHNLINKNIFLKMKKTSFIINTARGGIINEDDLYEALVTNQIAGAALDTYTLEPPVNEKLIELNNLVCTPHIGGNSQEAVKAMGLSAIDNIKEFLL